MSVTRHVTQSPKSDGVVTFATVFLVATMSSTTSPPTADIGAYLGSPKNKGVKRKRTTIVVDKCMRPFLVSLPLRVWHDVMLTVDVHGLTDELDIDSVDPEGPVSPAVIAAMKQRIIEVRLLWFPYRTLGRRVVHCGTCLDSWRNSSLPNHHPRNAHGRPTTCLHSQNLPRLHLPRQCRVARRQKTRSASCS